MRHEASLKLPEQWADAVAVEVEKEKHRREEKENLPDRDEEVDVVPCLLQSVLHPAELADRGEGGPSVHVVLPPAGGGEEHRNWDGARHQVVVLGVKGAISNSWAISHLCKIQDAS